MGLEIRGLIKVFITYLKKTWILGVVCVAFAIVFILTNTFQEKREPIVSDEVSVANVDMLGTQSILKLSWAFEENASGEESVNDTRISNAKDDLAVIQMVANSGSFKISVDMLLKENDMDIVQASEAYTISIASYNTIIITVFGNDADRVGIIEQIIRERLNGLIIEKYEVVETEIISEPVVLVAQELDGVKVLTSELYEISTEEMSAEEKTVAEEDKASNDVSQSEQQTVTLFSLKNIIVLASSIALWLCICLILTIADNRIYSTSSLKEFDIKLLGEISESDEKDKEVLSIVNNILENKNSDRVKVLALAKTNKNNADEFLCKLKEMCIKDVELTYWKESYVNGVNSSDVILVAVRKGENTGDEITNCISKLALIGVEYMGVVLY